MQNSNLMAYQYTGDEVLDIMHQYAKRRNLCIEQLIRKHLAWEDRSAYQLLEFGAGKGEFIDRFIDDEVERHVVELDDTYRHTLASRHRAFRLIDDVPEKSQHGIYLIDVLEHLEDDVAFLQQFYQKLKAGGKLFIYVPARPELFSSFDESIGHYRRYLRKDLAHKVATAGFEVKTVHYHELLGYFAAVYNALFSKGGKLSPKMVAIYDRWMVPVDNFLAKLFPPPIGKSIYLLAEKPL